MIDRAGSNPTRTPNLRPLDLKFEVSNHLFCYGWFFLGMGSLNEKLNGRDSPSSES
jgi:hypothetical protein